jgi:hypothetical protein
MKNRQEIESARDAIAQELFSLVNSSQYKMAVKMAEENPDDLDVSIYMKQLMKKDSLQERLLVLDKQLGNLADEAG